MSISRFAFDLSIMETLQAPIHNKASPRQVDPKKKRSFEQGSRPNRRPPRYS